MNGFHIDGDCLIVGGGSGNDRIALTNHGAAQPIEIYIGPVNPGSPSTIDPSTKVGEVPYGSIDCIKIYGRGGNDYITIAALIVKSETTILGGEGDDTVFAGSGGGGPATIYGGNGNDSLMGGGADDLIYGEAGDDKLGGNNGNDILFGGADNDALNGGDGADIAVGGDGNDLIGGGNARDLLVGGDGQDTVVGNADEDILIAAMTDYDDGTAAHINDLKAIMAVWTGAGTASTRSSSIKAGLTGTGARLDTTTITDDDWIDVLYGDNTGSATNGATDWFLCNRTGSNGKAIDTIAYINSLSAAELAILSALEN